MNTMPDNIIVNSCQYTPVYLIQNPGTTQTNSYFLAQSNQDEQKPIIDNLKTFYENSGNIEQSVRNINSSPKPRILKKQDSGSIGNNLKLASFLLPKNDIVNKQYILNNVILKPTETITATNTCTTSTLPKFDFDSKIVKLKDVPITTRKTLPKIKPKEITPAPNPSKLTSVQLIKLGETYHSLNQLSDDQMKMVNQALKIFSDPEKIAPEPTYDPVTNTQFIYKVVSPRDLTVVGKNKIKIKKNDVKKEYTKKIEDKITKPKVQECVQECEPSPPIEPKVTRSGRKVKLPKQSLPDSPHRPKKKNTIVTCFQCSAEFTSLYRLQKHYENHPTHIPGRVHSNLFHCLLAIMKGSSEENRTNIFIQQLEELIDKLRSLLPCLLKTSDTTEGNPCTINDDVSRLLGMKPGAYNLDIDALYCVKNKGGFCKHNPAQPYESPDVTPSVLWKPVHGEDTAPVEAETEDCARINSVDKWPIVNKRIWKPKQPKSQENAKRMRLASESCDTLIELGMEDLVTFSKPNDEGSVITGPQGAVANDLLETDDECNIDQPELVSISPAIEEESKKTKSNHTQFHSAHFDIRSSPMKPSSTVFRKFQINPDKLANIRSLDVAKKENKNVKEIPSPNTENALQEIFRDNDLSSKDSFTIDGELKDWILNRSNDDKSEDGFTKCDSLIEPALIHIKDNENKLPVNNVDPNDLQHDNHNESVLNFLDTLGNACLSYPGTEIRTNNVEFPLDLFTFHNS